MSAKNPSPGKSTSRDSDGEKTDRLAALIPDAALRKLIDEDPDELCSLIVEADLPKRIISLQRPQKRVASGKKTESTSASSSQDREAMLSRLADELRKIVGEKNLNVLESSGSIVIKVPASKLKKVSRVANIKAIRPNRKLRPVKRIGAGRSR